MVVWIRLNANRADPLRSALSLWPCMLLDGVAEFLRHSVPHSVCGESQVYLACLLAGIEQYVAGRVLVLAVYLRELPVGSTLAGNDTVAEFHSLREEQLTCSQCNRHYGLATDHSSSSLSLHHGGELVVYSRYGSRYNGYGVVAGLLSHWYTLLEWGVGVRVCARACGWGVVVVMKIHLVLIEVKHIPTR